MKQADVVEYFKTTYPGKNILLLPSDEPTEIICEIDPAVAHPDYSIAIAAIRESEPHYHERSTETYTVTRGQLTLFVDNEIIRLNTGDSYVIQPGQIHFSKGDFTLVEVKSEPGWNVDDHFIVK